jgi:hypothetical protein
VETYFAKELVLPDTSTEIVDVAPSENPGIWVEGEHPLEVRARAAGGGDTVVSERLSDNALLWAQGSVTFRLETPGDLTSALALARSLS